MADRSQYCAQKIASQSLRGRGRNLAAGTARNENKVTKNRVPVVLSTKRVLGQPENDNELVAYLEALVVIEIGLALLCGIALILVFNCWIMRQHLRAIEEQLKLTSEALQLEIHAIRDVMEEAAQKRTES